MGRTGRIMVAMSGGVDSSVAAAILQDQGFEPVGVTFRMLPETLDGAAGLQSWEQAASVCEQLNMEHRVIDCRDEFMRKVLEPAWKDYSEGRTPNPCVVCNPRVKFQQLLEVARKNGVELIATGHHARIVFDTSGPQLCRGKDPAKDQSYFLYALGPEQLRALRLPIGDMSKEEVRAMARKLGLNNAEQPDSQDACFATGDDNFARSLCALLKKSPPEGPIVDEHGHKIAQHGGVHLFTIGQRRGLGVALGKPAWVKSIDPETSTVLVTTRPDELLSSELIVKDLVLSPAYQDFSSGACMIKIRSTHRATDGFIYRLDEQKAKVTFSSLQRAVTPGQAAVFYDGDKILGGGTINLVL